MPCAEKLCGSEDTSLKRAKLKFKLDFDRQQLKPDAIRTIKCKIADHLGVRPSALYLCRIEEGCISLTFLVPHFITGLLLSLSDAQKIALHEDVKTLSIECKFETLHLVQDIKFEVKCLQEAKKEGKEVESKEVMSWNATDLEPLRSEVRSPRKVFDWFRRFTISRSSGSSSSAHLHSDMESTFSTEAVASCPHTAESFEVQKRKGHLGRAIKRIFLKMMKKTRSGTDSGYSSAQCSAECKPAMVTPPKLSHSKSNFDPIPSPQLCLMVSKLKVMDDSTDTSDDEGIEEELQNIMESASGTPETYYQQDTLSSTVPSNVSVNSPSKQ